jgi:hypothetical protein
VLITIYESEEERARNEKERAEEEEEQRAERRKVRTSDLDSHMSLVIILSIKMTKCGSKNALLTCVTRACMARISSLVHPEFS